MKVIIYTRSTENNFFWKEGILTTAAYVTITSKFTGFWNSASCVKCATDNDRNGTMYVRVSVLSNGSLSAK